MSTHGKTEMYTQVEVVSPALAEKWLESNYEQQRPLRWSWVEQLAERIRGGRWLLTHQGVAFDINGRLTDGQHRLWAIYEAKLPVRMNVSYNCPVEAFGVLDQHRVRSIADLAESQWITPRIVQCGRAMARGPVQSHFGAFDDRDPTLLLRFIENHREDIERVMAMMPTSPVARGRKHVTAVVMGAVLRASVHVSLKSLQRFLEVLMRGESAGDHERAAIILRDWLMANSGKRDRSTEYQKAQRAIKAFVDEDPISTLYAQPDDLYPLQDAVSARRLRVPAAGQRGRQAKGRKTGLKRIRGDAKA